MASKKIVTPEEVEEKREEYNRLIIKEGYLITTYSTTTRMHKITVAKQLRAVAAQLLALETYLDKYKTPENETISSPTKFHQYVG